MNRLQSENQPDTALIKAAPSRRPWERWTIVSILLVAAFFRLYQLDVIPPGLRYDEAYNGVDALSILRGTRPVFLEGNFGREALFIYWQAFSIKLLGHSALALRVVSATIGILTVAASYALVRRLYNARVALLCCAWLAISPWHVIFSRIGLRTVALPLFCALIFFALWRAMFPSPPVLARGPDGVVSLSRLRAAGWYAVAGVLLGLSLYVYTAARFLPFVILGFAAYLAIVHRAAFTSTWRRLIVTGLVAVLLFLPEAIYFVQHPEVFFLRASQVSVLNHDVNGGHPFQALGTSAVRSLGMFVVAGDANGDRNLPFRPIFDPVSSIAFLIGTGIAVRRWRTPSFGLLLIWIGVMLIPGILAARDAPNFLHYTGIIPAIYVLPSLGLDWLLAWSDHHLHQMRTRIMGIVLLGFLAGSAVTYLEYFQEWAHSPGVAFLFNADRWGAIQLALRLEQAEAQPTFVGAGDDDEMLSRYATGDQPAASRIHLFNGTRSLIFPGEGAASYVFAARDLPPEALRARFFPDPTGRVIARTADGQPITLLQLPRPPELLPSHPLPARFGQEIEVIGFDLPREARAGGTLTVRWYWRLLGSTPRELAFFNQLFDAQGQRRGQQDDRAFAPAYWPPGTGGISSFEVTVDPATSTGAAWLEVGIYERATLSRLPVFDPLGRSVGSQLRLGPIKVHGVGPTLPRIAHPLVAHFADQIDLDGYSVHRSTVGEPLVVTFLWRARGQPSRDYTVFVHLLDATGRLLTQADAPPANGQNPSSVWENGDQIVDLHTLVVPPGLTPGATQLEVGLYTPETGQRLPLLDSRGSPTADHLLLPGPTLD